MKKQQQQQQIIAMVQFGISIKVLVVGAIMQSTSFAIELVKKGTLMSDTNSVFL